MSGVGTGRGAERERAAADRAFEILRAGARGRVRRHAPLGPLTSYGLGGPAAVLLEAADEADLEALARAVEETGLEVLVIGRGSNMLVSDQGFDGIAVRLGAGFRWTRVEGDRVAAGAAVPLPGVAALAADRGLGGIEFAVAIPASVGGAVRMNAGAHGHAVGEVLEEVELYRLAARARERVSAERLGLAYRSSDLPPDALVVAARFALRPDDPRAIRRRMAEARAWRRATQPLGLPNAGSVFKNPPGEPAGRLVERIVGKGVTVGGARVSEVHANFIVAGPGARANDVYTLIERIRRRVRAEAGVELEPEVRLVGRFEEVEDEAAAR
jgi:UDP-N-acetylmuramate dehydrogenase